VVPACQSCNSRKHNKMVAEWLTVTEDIDTRRESALNRLSRLTD